jgi:hypothetical protein
MKITLLLCAILGLLAYVAGDCYMHVPRGSNNRLNEANTNRDNNNRLFDSQNNAKGGYCLGPEMGYYAGSELDVEWTVQHGCGGTKQQCNMVLQYMCSNANDQPIVQVRDGTTTLSPPDNAATYNQLAAGGGYTYGMHENYNYYQWCSIRQRNMGLFLADRVANIAGTTAQFTRQDNNGGQSGFECPEERDYYPYWHPAPWKDIAVLTDDKSLCQLFTTQSQNVMSKGYCAPSGTTVGPTNDYIQWTASNNQAACTQAGNTWMNYPSWGISAPVCQVNLYSRDNHLGNIGSGYPAHYNWTIPTNEACINIDQCACVLRLRYNISTFDFNGFYVPFADSTMNGANSPVTGNPTVNTSGVAMTLAMDTTQFFRTFQDRSFVFQIRPRPSGVSSTQRIFNLNVKGKRGNIVQTYPGTEYDFTPSIMQIRVGDYIHFQWTGCDTNPAGNAGQGQDQTDRSNLVQIMSEGVSYPASDQWLNSNPNLALLQDPNARYYFAFQNQQGCNPNSANTEDPANCKLLNAASPYFDGGLFRMNKTGTFYYMNTRNNNFTNRGQKAQINVFPILPPWGVAIVVIGSVMFAASMAIGAAMLYAKSHPGSQVANLVARM